MIKLIKGYEIPDMTRTVDENGNSGYKEFVPEYSLIEYEVDEFKKAYPDYNEYEWYTH